MNAPGRPEWRSYRFVELDAARLYRILALRQRVFVIEQRCIYPDIDDLDRESLHLCGWNGDSLSAYARCLPPGLDREQSSIGRVVVDPAARGLELGKTLVRRAIGINLATWPEHDIQIGAQARLRDFYGSMGFTPVSDVYDEYGISHVKMLLRKTA